MSNLINLDQFRARHALAAAFVKKNSDEGDSLSGFPSLIINNGLIATIAFSVDKGGQHERIAKALAQFLGERGVIQSSDATSLRNALCNSDSSTLRNATREALAFLSYLKRFHRS